MSAVPVSIASDHSSGPTLHLPVMPDAWDRSAPMNWPPGGVAGKHVLAGSVLHRGQPIVLDGHDLGPSLHHDPFDFFLASAKSSRKNIFAASTVIAQGKAIACIDDIGHFMMLCGDPICSPHGVNEHNATHTVLVGMTALDERKGDAAAIAAMVTDGITFIIDIGTADGPTTFADVGMDILGLDETKMLVGAGVGFVFSVAVSAESGWTEPIQLQLETGGGLGSKNASVSYDPQSGTIGASYNLNVLGYEEELQLEHRPERGPDLEALGLGEPWGEPL
jgi:hypothetical protein